MKDDRPIMAGPVLLKFVITVYLFTRCFIMVNRLVCMSGLLPLLLIGRHSAGTKRIHRKTTAVNERAHQDSTEIYDTQ